MASKPTLKNTPDEELVDCYRNSHETAYVGELYLRYTHLVYGICLKYLKNDVDAKEATMQLFEILVRELKRHRVTVFKSWLYSVATNFCTMEYRKKMFLKLSRAKKQRKKFRQVLKIRMKRTK